MASQFLIDGYSLDVFNVKVSAVEGLDIVPKVKERTKHSWPDESGVAVDTSTDITYEAVTFSLKCRIKDSSYKDAVKRFNGLVALLSGDGYHLLGSITRGKLYPVVLDEVTGYKQLTATSANPVWIEFTLKLLCPLPECRMGSATVDINRTVSIDANTGKQITVFWGNGDVSKGTGLITYTYPSAGTYQIVVAGTGLILATPTTVGVTIDDYYYTPNYVKLIDLNRNNDIIPVNSILPISEDATYLSARSGIGDHVITLFKTDIIRQSGKILKIRLAKIKTLTNFTRCDIHFWRKDGSTFDKIGSISLLPYITAGLNFVTIPSDVNLSEGDYYSYDLGASVANTDVISATAATSGSMYTTTDVPTNTDYPWLSKSPINYVARSIFYMQAPLLVGIGDSIMESYPLHTSFVDSLRSTISISKSWTYKLSQLSSKIVYQNCGFGGQTSSQILARFDEQVIAAHPRICIINAGLNDLGQSVNKALFIANVTLMLNKCRDNGIIPILWEIPPCDALSNTQMQSRDDWNNSLRLLMSNYVDCNGIIVNWDSLGVNRPGGDANNLWNINPAYAYGDGTHYNEVGQKLIADTMYLFLQTLIIQ